MARAIEKLWKKGIASSVAIPSKLELCCLLFIDLRNMFIVLALGRELDTMMSLYYIYLLNSVTWGSWPWYTFCT